MSDIEEDCIQCGKRIHSFWDDPVGDMFNYLRESRHWVEKIIVNAHNAKAFDLQFFLKGVILLKWQLEMIMNGMKIMCMRMEHLLFLDSVSLLPVALRKLPDAFGLTDAVMVPALFNYSSESRLWRKNPRHTVLWHIPNEYEFLAWYEGHKFEVFDNTRVL